MRSLEKPQKYGLLVFSITALAKLECEIFVEEKTKERLRMGTLGGKAFFHWNIGLAIRAAYFSEGLIQ